MDKHFCLMEAIGFGINLGMEIGKRRKVPNMNSRFSELSICYTRPRVVFSVNIIFLFSV
jgi:hypothetical protein